MCGDPYDWDASIFPFCVTLRGHHLTPPQFFLALCSQSLYLLRAAAWARHWSRFMWYLVSYCSWQRDLPIRMWAQGAPALTITDLLGGGVCSTGLTLMILSCLRRTSCLEGTGGAYKPSFLCSALDFIKRFISAYSPRGPGGEGCSFINKKLSVGR